MEKLPEIEKVAPKLPSILWTALGVDIPSIRQVIHIGPPCSLKAYFQETGRAGRDGKPAQAILYYNNRDIGKNRTGMQYEMK